MTLTPIRLFGPARITNVATTKFTVGAAIKNIVRHIHVINPSGAPVTFSASIGVDAVGTRIFDAFSIGAGQVLDHMCYYTLESGEIFQSFAGTTNVLVLTVSGDIAS